MLFESIRRGAESVGCMARFAATSVRPGCELPLVKVAMAGSAPGCLKRLPPVCFYPRSTCPVAGVARRTLRHLVLPGKRKGCPVVIEPAGGDLSEVVGVMAVLAISAQPTEVRIGVTRRAVGVFQSAIASHGILAPARQRTTGWRFSGSIRVGSMALRAFDLPVLAGQGITASVVNKFGCRLP